MKNKRLKHIKLLIIFLGFSWAFFFYVYFIVKKNTFNDMFNDVPYGLIGISFFLLALLYEWFSIIKKNNSV
jgi:hypothetical protein